MKPLRALLPSAILVICTAMIGFLPVMESLDYRVLDVLWRRQAPHPDIAIVAIDTKSLQKIGRWPWSRNVHARMLRTLQTADVRAAGIDIMFAEGESAEADGELAASMRSVNFPIVLPVERLQYAGNQGADLLLPLQTLRAVPGVSLGHVGIPASGDGFARFFPEPIPAKDRTYDPFGVEIARRLGAAPPPTASSFINFVGPAGTFPTVSYSDVLDGTVPQDQLQGKIVLIGVTSSDLHDVVSTPLSPSVMSGVEWQANIVSGVLLQSRLSLIPRGATVFWGALLALAVLLIFHLVPIRTAFGLAPFALLIVPVVSIVAWNRHIVLPFLFIDLLLVFSFVMSALHRWYKAEAEKRALRRSLQSYLSPLVLQEILKDPSMLKLGGYRREITAFFSDVRNFTTITESTDPHVLANLLYEYFTAMTDEVFALDGVVCQFMGDGLYSFWGAPLVQSDHSVRAVRAGIRMMKKLHELRPQWEARGLPFVDIGIGINSGMATIGNLGSAKRFDFTAIGDCVNAAARLESLNKEHKTHMLVSQIIVDRLPPDIHYRFVGEVLVKGKTVPLRVYEITEDNWCTPDGAAHG